MSGIQETTNTNPLTLIFKTTDKGEMSEELNSIKNIPLFFKYLLNENVSQEDKINIIEKFTEIINENRYICEYFSSYDNKSIYIFFIDLYLSKSTSAELKSAIINLFQELIINVETDKNIYEFIFQKFSALYRGRDDPTPENLFNLLTLLNTILGETDNMLKPRNYFSCSGAGRFEVDLNKEKIELGTYLTFVINFKIGASLKNPEALGNANLIKIDFTNGQSYTIELEKQMFLKIKESGANIKVCPPKEWINLVVSIYNLNNKLDFYFFFNGENSFNSHKINTKNLRSDDCIDSIIFFDNFYGEVSSITMAVTKEANNWSISNNFLKWFGNHKEGFWKKKYLDSFLEMLKELVPTDSNYTKSRTVYFKKAEIKDNPTFTTFKKNYADYLVFIFTPFNCFKLNDGEVESSIRRTKLIFNGNIRNHQYQCYQKKLVLVNGITNLIPIAELFLLRPKVLNEENLALFLKIIVNVLNYRKYNIKAVKECSLFQILSLFIEKYPKYLFTEKILENFVGIGKTIFSNNDEILCKSYFEHIFLNEKILSKYSENLQIKLWQQVLLFCQSDKDQIETFMNINRICLILRFYDKNKYTEMCCETHLSKLKEEYVGSKTVMNPTMNVKLTNLEKLLSLVIESQDPANVISLFKLLTLDLSPCLTKFILNIFSNTLQMPAKEEKNIMWKNKLVEEFINNKYETIVINTFIHSLPDVRFDLLRFTFEIYNQLLKTKKISYFKTFENMLKTCLLPKKMFYATYKESKSYLDEIKKKKMEEKQKEFEEQKQKNNLRMSSISSYNFARKLNNSIKPEKPTDDIGEKINEENENEINENENEKNPEENKEDFDKENNNNNDIDILANIKEVEENKINDNECDDNAENLKIIQEEKNDNADSNENLQINQEEKKDNADSNENLKINQEEKNDNSDSNENLQINQEEKNDNADSNENLQINQEEKKDNADSNENLKINQEEKKDGIEDEDLDLEGNLNINEQIEKTSSKNEIMQTPKEKEKDKEKEENVFDIDIKKKAETPQKNLASNLSRSTFDRFNTLIEGDKDSLSLAKGESVDLAKLKTIKIKDEAEKEVKVELDEENLYLEEEDENVKKEIVIKDELFEEYKKDLFDKFLVWSLGINIEIPLESLILKNMPIANVNILEILFALDKEINDINLTLKFFKAVEQLISSIEQNSYNILTDKKIYSLFLDTTFKFHKKNEKTEQTLYELGKKILLTVFMNSFIYVEKKHIDKYPCYEIDSIFLWGEQIPKSNKNYNNVFEFLNELLLELMIQFKTKFETKMNFKINADIKSNFYLKNYFIMLTQLFRFSFHFQNSSTDFNDINLKSKFMDKYTFSMHLELSQNRINEMWVNFPFFDDIYKRINNLWDKDNIYKKLKLSNPKKNKLIKYEENILQKVILDKNYKNVHQNELILLTYEEINKESNIESIIPLIRTIPITLMCIISVLSKKTNKEKELLYWLKEYKKFIKYLIISSSNLTRINQLEFYNYIQDKCIGPIITSICFLKHISKTSLICKEKIVKTLHSILLFCFIITKYQYKYIIKHKSGIKIFNIYTKPARNDLKLSAVFLLFSDMLKDKTGNSVIPLSKLDQLSVNQYVNIINLLDNEIWNEALYNNQNLKNKLSKEFFTFVNFQNVKNIRSNLIKEMSNDKDEKYTEEILDLLPLYERELSKYSNNSLENTIQKKNRYKAIKKKSFSWRGFWSDRKLFFENTDQLKLKMINHYTKSFMKPFLVPILDIEYYLPEFSGFKIDSLFIKNKDNDTNNNEGFKLTMDIDKILKLSELNQIAMNNIKESFGEKKAKARENYLRKIYLKSNKELAESLKNITNNLDLGKEEEFTKLEHNSGREINKSNLTKNKAVPKKKYFLSCMVKTSHHIKGVCFIDEKQLNFRVFLNQRTGNSMSGVELAFTNKDDDYDQDRQTCFGSYFVCHPKDKDLYQITIDYKNIKWIFRRRYYYKNSAIEIFTTTNKSFYFNFKFEKDRETVIEEITSKIKDLTKIYDDIKDPKDSFDNIIGFENPNVIHSKKKTKKTKLSKKIEMWKNWEISNFELLMWLNIYGNRSYNDISQYPVFPWILSNYEDPLKTETKIETKVKKKKTLSLGASLNDASDSEDEDAEENKLEYSYRDLSLPMGMLELSEEGERRKELFMETYDTLKSDPDSEIKPYIYGSNYSNPMYVCNFLMRLFPFTHISIELQGHKFDNADRLFLSVKNSFYNSTTQKTDVRELIPEFFYLPEMFLNINLLNLGVLEDGTTVNDVLTPCDNNPYDFIITMRKVLESEKLSRNLQNWIDLIFGYKARGKEAEAARNLFTDASYQENIDIQKLENKESMLRQVEFGLIPTQILNKECGKRIKKEDIIKGKEITDSKCELGLNKCKKHADNQGGKHTKDKKEKELSKNNEIREDGTILAVGSFASEKLSIMLNNDIFVEKKISCPVFDKVYTDEQINKLYFEKQYNKMAEFYSNDSSNNKAMAFLQHGKVVIMGGFFDGKAIFVPTDGKRQIHTVIPFKDESPILSIACDKDDEFIFMGNAVGNVCVYINNDGNYKSKYLLSDQNSPISHIYCNEELNLLATASIDGYICLYTLPLCKLIRCFKVPTEKCSYVFLCDSPLPFIVVISDEENNSEIYIYSINGKFYSKKEEYFKISSPLLIKDIDSMDYLACIGNDTIYIISIPDLVVQVSIEKMNGIHSICFSEDNKTLYAINKKGTEVTVIKEEKQKFYRSASFMKRKAD